MELVKMNDSSVLSLFGAQETSSDAFISANTSAVTMDHLKNDCIIPVFAKDNESTISHTDFVQVTEEVVRSYFNRERILRPAMRVSHEIKGRVPEARGKKAELLLPEEITKYYERLAFAIEIPSIAENVNGNNLSLTVGGVRALNHENLYSRKTEERFKIFVGFKNRVCTNLCVWSDGYQDDIRVRTIGELYGKLYSLFQDFNAKKQITVMKQFGEHDISESQFAQILGRARMYQYLPSSEKAVIPSFPLSDTQVSIVAKEYFNDENFRCETNGSLNLWKMYNLLTGANKTSYIDSLVNRAVDCTEFVDKIRSSLHGKTQFWYLN